MRTLTKSSLDSIKIRVENKFHKNEVLFSDYENMRENIIFLIKENSLLKEKLFELSQEVPEDKKWENILSSKIELALLNNNGKEFLEISNSINNQIYTIIIQKKFGKTPKQLLDSSENRRIKAVKKNVSLHKHIVSLQEKCTQYSNEILAITKIVSNPTSVEELEISKEIVNTAIVRTRELVSRFNSNLIKFEAVKMHKSYLHAYHEGWRRAVDAENKVDSLKEKIKRLKGLILQKKYPYCRIYKGKLKRG